MKYRIEYDTPIAAPINGWKPGESRFATTVVGATDWIHYAVALRSFARNAGKSNVRIVDTTTNTAVEPKP